jgi:WD40 repeat protein
LRWWDAVTGHELRKIDLPETAEGLAISSDGKTVVASIKGVGLRVWNLANGQETTPVELPSGIKGGRLLFTPNGRQLIVALGAQVFVLNWPGLKVDRLIELPKPVNQPGETDCQFVTVSSDSRWLITVAYRSIFSNPEGHRYQSVADGVADLWDLATGKRVRRLVEEKNTISTASFTPDDRVLLTDVLDNTIPGEPGRNPKQFSGVIALLDPFAPRWLRSFAPIQPRSESIIRMSATAELAPDGRTLYVAYNTGEIRCFEVATGQLRRTLKGHRGHVYCLSFTPDGRRLISGGRDGSAVIWDVTVAAVAKSEKESPDDAEIERLWAKVSAEDAPAAYGALGKLAAWPDQSVEMLRQRFKQNLEDPTPARLSQIRAIELLEGIATPAARSLLADLAKGAAKAPLTVDAASSLARLKR